MCIGRVGGIVAAGLLQVLLWGCPGDPLEGMRFGCDPEWAVRGEPDPCGAGCACVPKEGQRVHGVCVCGQGAGDPVADSTTDLPAADVGDLTADGPQDPGLDADGGTDQGPWRCATSEDCEGRIQVGPCERPKCEPDTGECVAVPDLTLNGASCDDANPCTGNERCVAGACLGVPDDCDDGNPCTDDSCDPLAGCIHLDNVAPCRTAGCDGLLFLPAATCAGGQCPGVSPVPCDDKNPCTDDTCDAATGCGHTNNSAECAPARCEGGVYFAPSRCLDGGCLEQIGVPCDDGNQCTDDTCDAATGCGHSNNSAQCAPAQCEAGMYYPAPHCLGGSCHVPPGVSCDDGKACTDDSCSPDEGCASRPKAGWCLIEGECYTDGQEKTGEPCRLCLSGTAPEAWSDAPAGTSCGPNAICVSGVCESTCCTADECPPGYQAHDGCHCKVVPTGVTKCRTDSGLVDCASIAEGQDWYGQDGHFGIGLMSFTDLGDGTVRDERTGLVWSRAVLGIAKWKDGETYPARALCEEASLPGEGWRLPHVFELLAIVDYSKGACPMWGSVFGTTCPTTSQLWSATQVTWSSFAAFGVWFNLGTVNGGVMSNAGLVRCVRP